MRRFTRTCVLLLLAGLCGAIGAEAQSPKKPAAERKGIGRWAFLVGVDDYTRAEKLHYCGADMQALAEQLTAAGFPKDHVYLLHDKAQETRYRPVKANIEEQLELVLKLVERDDLVVVAFSGHGVHLDGKSYLCPPEVRLDDPKTMISLDGVYERLEKCPAALKIMLVDACRDDPRPGGTRSLKATDEMKQFAASLEKPPRGILLLTSCAPGEQSREEKEFGHGVFMHFVLKGLQGEADGDNNGKVSLLELYKFANDRTKSYVAKKFSDSQRPALKGEIDDDFDLTLAASSVPPRDVPLRVEPASPKENVNSIGMKMVLIPAGEFMMGSPDSDKDAYGNEKPQHRVRITKPFYLGAFEVTQAQYEKIMGTNPSRFKGPTRPVETVSWGQAVEFCRRLSEQEGKTYRLPMEAEWEYACRAGTQARYYWGDSNSENVVKEHCLCEFDPQVCLSMLRGDYPFGKGTQPVGQKRPNAWGLYDMSGNVGEWCADFYREKYYAESPSEDPQGPSSEEDPFLRGRVIRGGEFLVLPRLCRSANRVGIPEYYSIDYFGFRAARTQ